MLYPLYDGFYNENDAKVAQELQYYLNCNTCTEMVNKLREQPNDELLVDVIVTTGINVCSEIISQDSCRSLAKKFKANIMTHFFNLFVTDDFICGYLMPLCDQPKY